MARELDGIIRIGAINCQDEWGLCTSQGIQSYPSLKLFPTVSVCHDQQFLLNLNILVALHCHPYIKLFDKGFQKGNGQNSFCRDL